MASGTGSKFMPQIPNDDSGSMIAEKMVCPSPGSLVRVATTDRVRVRLTVLKDRK